MTGAARRLGRATALALARAGADVVVHYRGSAAEAAATAEEIRRHGRSAWLAQADLAEPAAAELLFRRAVAEAGPVDILVNSASVFAASGLLGFAADELARNVQVNAVSPLGLCRAFAAQGRGGDIVNFLDSRVVDYDRRHVAYHLSKRMLYEMTKMLALELAPAIKVNAVAPGLILPPPGEDDGYLARHARTNPLQRHGEAEEVAATVVFLIATRFITGQVIFIDGGRHLKGCVYG